jgi:hypothetical protein
MTRVARILAVTLAAAALACGDSTAPVNQGSFTASITGDLTASLTGRAVFGVATQGTNQGFVIALERQGSSQVDRDVIVMGRLNTQRPGEGTYPIVSCVGGTCGADDFDAGYVFYRTSGDFAFFSSDAGTLTITESSAEKIVGTITFDGVWVLSSESVTARDITITASFTAVPGALPSVG